MLPLVVRAGGGSARDSLSILDQLLAGAGPDGVTYARAVALLGVTDGALLDDMVDALAAGDAAGVYGTVDRVVEAGHDPRRFSVDLLDRFRDLILLDAVPDAARPRAASTCPQDQLDAHGRPGRCASAAATLTRYAEIVHTALIEMRGHDRRPRLVLELLCARMLLPDAATDSAALLQRLERLERRLTAGAGRAPARPRPRRPPRGARGPGRPRGRPRRRRPRRPAPAAAAPRTVAAGPPRRAAPRPGAASAPGGAAAGGLVRAAAAAPTGRRPQPRPAATPGAPRSRRPPPARRPRPRRRRDPDPPRPRPRRRPARARSTPTRCAGSGPRCSRSSSSPAAAPARCWTTPRSRDVDGELVGLSAPAALAKMIGEDSNTSVLRAALTTVVGGEWKIAVEGGEARLPRRGGAAGRARRRGRPARRRTAAGRARARSRRPGRPRRRPIRPPRRSGCSTSELGARPLDPG